jgi:hypothetical protein
MEPALGEKKRLNVKMKKFLSSWVRHVKELEQNKETYFKRIGITCLKQRILQRIGNKNVKGFKVIQELFSNRIELLTENGIFDEIHADPDKTIIHTIFTDNDSNIDFQEAHTEYDYMPRQTDSETPSNTLGVPTCPSQMKEVGLHCGLVPGLVILCIFHIARYYYSDPM